MHPVSCTNIDDDITGFVNHGMEKYENLNVLRMEHNFSTK